MVFKFFGYTYLILILSLFLYYKHVYLNDLQIKTTEESSKRYQEEKIALQQENSNLKLQLQREQEKTRNYIPSQMAYQQPLVQSAGLQPQRQVIFGQQVPQPRPQQYQVPTFDQQRLPQIPGNTDYMSLFLARLFHRKSPAIVNARSLSLCKM